jgi:hypothetical protein
MDGGLRPAVLSHVAPSADVPAANDLQGCPLGALAREQVLDPYLKRLRQPRDGIDITNAMTVLDLRKICPRDAGCLRQLRLSQTTLTTPDCKRRWSGQVIIPSASLNRSALPGRTSAMRSAASRASSGNSPALRSTIAPKPTETPMERNVNAPHLIGGLRRDVI